MLYSRGRYDPWWIDYSECERFPGQFVDDSILTVSFRDGHRGRFEFIDLDDVNGTYSSESGDTRGSFSRI